MESCITSVETEHNYTSSVVNYFLDIEDILAGGGENIGPRIFGSFVSDL